MSTSHKSAVVSEFMSKAEVCAFLGKSKRTIEILVSRKGLEVFYVQGRNGQTAQYRRDQIEAIHREMTTPVPRTIPIAVLNRGRHVVAAEPETARPAVPAADLYRQGREVIDREPSADPWRAALERLAAVFPAPETARPWLTLDEAAEWSGLPKAYLLAEARRGNAFARNAAEGVRPCWRFSRERLKG